MSVGLNCVDRPLASSRELGNHGTVLILSSDELCRAEFIVFVVGDVGVVVVKISS